MCSEVGRQPGPYDSDEKGAEGLIVAWHGSIVLHAAQEFGEGYGDGLLWGCVPAVGVENEVGVGTRLCANMVDEGIGNEMGFVRKFGGFGELDEVVGVRRIAGGVVGIFTEKSGEVRWGGWQGMRRLRSWKQALDGTHDVSEEKDG